MKRRSVRLTALAMVLLIALGLLAGCGAKNTPTEAVQKQLDYIQVRPKALTGYYYSKEFLGENYQESREKYWNVINDLLGDFEYEVTGEKDIADYAGKKQKAVTVSIKGYDIGAALREYNENLEAEAGRILLSLGYTMGQVMSMSPEDMDKAVDEVQFAYFSEVMEACRAAGMTYEAEGDLTTTYNSSAKEWQCIQTLQRETMVDLLTDGMHTILTSAEGE